MIGLHKTKKLQKNISGRIKNFRRYFLLIFMKISRWSVSDFLLLQASLHELSAADRTE